METEREEKGKTKGSSPLNPDSAEPEGLLSGTRWDGFKAAFAGRAGLQWFPLGKVLKKYRGKDLKADLKAGSNVALLDFPQGMAYAVIAGLPFTMGVFASAVAAFLGPLFASSRFVMLGPTNAIAVLTLSAFMGMGLSGEQVIAAMPLLLLMIAGLMILGGWLGVAGAINYVSRSVVTGYVTAAAFLICIKQMKQVLGLTLPSTSTFLDALTTLVSHLPESQWQPALVSLMTLVVYFLAKRFLRAVPTVAITLLVMYGISRFFPAWGWNIAPLSNVSLEGGFWHLSWPVFSFDLLVQLAQPAIAIAFLSLLESASIAKTLAAQAGDQVNVNQQMVSMGVANAGCAFLSGMPISGSLTRSSLNFQSGARTVLSSMISAVLLTAGIFFLAPHLATLPMPSLATLVILVGISLINKKNIRLALGATNSDAAVFMTTFITGLVVTLDTAILMGVAVSVFLFMKKAGHPVLREFALTEEGSETAVADQDKPALGLLHVDGDLFFGSSDIFLDQARNLAQNPQLKVVLLRLRNAHNLDASCAMAIEQLHRFIKGKGGTLLICGAHIEVEKVLRNSGLLKQIGPENVFREDPDNPMRSQTEALKRARALVGDEMDVRLFVSRPEEK